LRSEIRPSLSEIVILAPRTSHLNHRHDDPTAIAHAFSTTTTPPAFKLCQTILPYLLDCLPWRLFQRYSCSPRTSAIHLMVAEGGGTGADSHENKSTPDPDHNNTTAALTDPSLFQSTCRLPSQQNLRQQQGSIQCRPKVCSNLC
jgi:hypothetical protein